MDAIQLLCSSVVVVSQCRDKPPQCIFPKEKYHHSTFLV
uniref:Uncharacterized protein n=1 Tax=Arundo donax TaxID=35708 RepID=A0A0A9FQR6_ARUDO